MELVVMTWVQKYNIYRCDDENDKHVIKHSQISEYNSCSVDVTWTNPNKLKKLYNKQKHAARIICNEDRLAHAKPLMKSLKILNIYQVNIFQTLNFMQKNKTKPKSKIIFTNISTYNT